MTPHSKLMAVISILQKEILARDTSLVPDKLFGGGHMDTPALELAEQMLRELLPIVDLAER